MEFLLKEAQALSLPCFDLVPAGSGDEVSAYWKGRRSDLPETFPKGVTMFKYQKHFLSIEQTLFDQLDLQAGAPLALSMFTSTANVERLNNVNVSTGNLAQVKFDGSIALTAKPAISLPPLEALLLYGGEPIQEWLSSRGLKRWEYDKVGAEIRDQYRKIFDPQFPLFMDEPPYVRVGGWHTQWPEDYFYTPREMRLMVWTFQDSEPWYEVFLSPLGNIVVKERIT